MLLVLLSVVLLLVLWFWKGRDWAVAKFPVLLPLKLKLDALYVKFFGASRIMLVSRLTTVMGFLFTVFDTIQPILDVTVASGAIDFGTLVPSAPWLGPLLMTLGHVITSLRQSTTTSLEENRAVAVAQIEAQKASLAPVNAPVAPVVQAPVVAPIITTEGTPNA